MSDTARYAIYFAPPADSPLWRFGSAVLGYDAETGADVPHRALPGVDPADWPALSAEPRVYGFHATLKAPFRLADGMTRADVFEATQSLATRQRVVALDGLAVTTLGSFVALTPVGDVTALNALALRATSELDVLRAPLNEAELRKRLKSPLTERQRAQLERFGYPYVGEDFRFHMTLSGSLPAERVAPVAAALREAYTADVLAGPVAVDALAIFEQAAPGERFRIIGRFPLG
jgi:putative phosphonate metabolism protein